MIETALICHALQALLAAQPPTPAPWLGCRGNGTSACSELVNEGYFKNHPGCSPTAACGGQYFGCSAQCPVPLSSERRGAVAGAPGNWSGCRGNGASVCTDLANESYFAAYPECAPNVRCDGEYFSCSDRCPPPAASQRRGAALGSPGNWSGCRGDGLSVCTELANEAYFAAHPSCTPNVGCRGQFATCNAQCPPPAPHQRRVPSADGTPGNWAGCRGNGLSVCTELANERYYSAHPDCQPNVRCGGAFATCSARCPPPGPDEWR